MSESLLSVGLDVGTTTTQLIVSRLEVEDRAGTFAVPQLQITRRQILYRSQVYFTPLVDESRVDGEAIARLVAREYENAGIRPEDVDTGAIIITGETSRKENAAAVLESLSGFAGDFVAATAGPDLESSLAAKGAGAVAYSRQTGKRVLHMDIGGGTSNLALIEDGRITATGCLNVGGRLLKTAGGRITYVSPVLQGFTQLQPGDDPDPTQIRQIAQILAEGLEMAAGLRPKTDVWEKLLTREASGWEIPRGELVISFSGGVADCIQTEQPPGQFGDMGGELGQAIAKSQLCRGEFMLGRETIRATVIGAGAHSAQLSGSTVFCQGVTLPVKNLPVAVFSAWEQEQTDLTQRIRRRMQELDTRTPVLAFPGYAGATYDRITALAQALLSVGTPLYICLEQDMAKALGQKLWLMGCRACLCIDGVQLQEGSYLDVGAFVGPALPVVVKTLVLET